MKTRAYLSVVLVSCLLAACTSGSDTDNRKASSKDKALLEAVKNPLDQARQFGKQNEDAAEAERKKIEEQEEQSK